jgi:hypothetical protein
MAIPPESLLDKMTTGRKRAAQEIMATTLAGPAGDAHPDTGRPVRIMDHLPGADAGNATYGRKG